MSQLKPTSGIEWRKPREEGEIITLPTGKVARLRPVALDVLLTTGKIPDFLSGIAAKTLWMETDTAAIADVPELAKGFAELINLLLPIAFLEPRIVGNPQADNEISLSDLDYADKVGAFQIVTAGVEAMRSFRIDQAKRLATVPDGENVQPATEQPGGGERPVDSATA